MWHLKHKRAGYTLVEALIYIAILVAIIAVLVSGLVVVVQSITRVRVARNLADTGGASMERLIREIRQATSIDDGNSIFNQTPGRLKLNTIDQAGNATTVDFTVSGNQLLVQVGVGSIDNLTSGQIQVSSLIFRKLATTTASGVRVELTVTDDRLPGSPINFYSTAILRGSY